MQTVKRAARFLHPLGAAGVVALVFLQVYLIAAYIFGDSGVLNSHVTHRARSLVPSLAR